VTRADRTEFEFYDYLQVIHGLSAAEAGDIVENELLGLLGQPNCIYDQWQSDQATRERHDPTVSLSACP